jgi:hypothetical protein
VWALALAAALGASCGGPDPRTQVMVLIDADPTVKLETERLRISVRGGRSEAAGGLDLREQREFQRDAPGAEALVWPTLVAVVPLDGDVGRIFELEAEAIDGTRRSLVLARARTGFVAGRTLALRLRLEDACRGVFCRAGTTCRQARCVDALVPVTSLPPYDPGAPEEDGGVGPPTCETSAECDDGVACNGEERCLDGACAPGTPLLCDDGVACTRDVCRGSGCVAEPDDTACTAGPGGRCDPSGGCQYDVCDATTCAPAPGECVTTRCDGARCVREPRCGPAQSCCAGECVALGCTDGNDCTSDSCGSRGCVHAPRVGAACSDGDACTQGDVCDASGSCRGAPRACDDGNPCTDDACDPRSGCTSAPNAAPCDDLDPCTVGDVCRGGTCQPGTPCNDGVDCTVDSCRARMCVFTPDNARCTAAPGGVCDARTGCQYPTCSPATCVAANRCETATCVGNVCMRSPVACPPDGNPCTDDVCDPTAGCQYVPNAAPCNDFNVCTMNDTCTRGVCVGVPRSCDDGNVCTDDSCRSGTGCQNLVRAGEPCGGTACMPRVCDLFGTCVPTSQACVDDNPGDCIVFECIDPGGCVPRPQPRGSYCLMGGCDGACDMLGNCVTNFGGICG